MAAGDDLVVSVVVQNKGIAHNHVPEQRDFYESWVEFQVKDSAGKTIMDSGAIGQDGELDPGAHSFTNRLVNTSGVLNDLHQVWDTRIIAFNNTIISGRSQIVRFGFKLPAGVAGPITLTAKVNYRRFNQRFIEFGLGKHYQLPVVEMASRTRTIALGANQPAPPDAEDNPLWMRWNNYGIGLLDAQQYADSAAAFERVAQLRPDYADAYTNVAIANYSWQRYDQSRTQLEKALKLSPKNARALYYLALVERIQGNLDAAVADLREMAAQYPRSRDAHRELGFSLYQQHKYDEARQEYETVQSIDPDDLAAHYILSIVYRRLGMKDKAAVEAAAFADQKDDPTANTYALDSSASILKLQRRAYPGTFTGLPDKSSPRQVEGQGNEEVVRGFSPAPVFRFARHGIVKEPARAWRGPVCHERMPALPHHQECRRPQGPESFQRGKNEEQRGDSRPGCERQQSDAGLRRRSSAN